MASILDEYEDSLYRSASVQQSRASVGIPHSGRCAAAPTHPSARAGPRGQRGAVVTVRPWARRVPPSGGLGPVSAQLEACSHR